MYVLHHLQYAYRCTYEVQVVQSTKQVNKLLDI